MGPFWDANEMWLVLGVGILPVAFPMVHGQVLGTLDTPFALMLAGLILRGATFDFWAKARVGQKNCGTHSSWRNHLQQVAFVSGSTFPSTAAYTLRHADSSY